MSPSESDLSVTLVIPGRNAAGTLQPCLKAVAALVERGEVAEIIFVDDGSTDETAKIVAEYPVRSVEGPARGPGAARNVGWRLAKTPLVWFIDSDCVAEGDALSRLLPYFQDPAVVGVGGSYANMRCDSFVACLIHEEIRVRHLAMDTEVDFLGTFNVAFRRSALASVDGFAEKYIAAEDGDLAFRLSSMGGKLRFDVRSTVGHFHESNWRRYLRAQYRNAFYRVPLYLDHPQFAKGDSYSSLIDHIQPPLAMLVLVALPFAFLPNGFWVTNALTGLLLLAQLPMTIRLVRATRQTRYLLFSLFGFVRAFARGLGMTAAVVTALLSRRRRTGPDCS